jgi:hypothetical protein
MFKEMEMLIALIQLLHSAHMNQIFTLYSITMCNYYVSIKNQL